MAIDTRDKRASAVDVMLPWRSQLPNPSGTVGASSRAILALLYAGFWTTPVVGAAIEWIVRARRRARR